MKKKKKALATDRDPKRIPRKHLPGYVFVPKDGYYQVRKAGLTADRVNTDPAFYYTRLLAAQFSTAAKLAHMLLNATSKPLGIKCRINVLTGLIQRGMLADDSNFYGNGTLLPQNLVDLLGFNFNDQAHFNDVCTLPISIRSSAAAGSRELSIPAFVPEHYIQPPAGATHARIWLISASLDPQQRSCERVTTKTTCFPIKRVHVKAQVLDIPPKSKPHFVQVIALGIQWYGCTNGQIRLTASMAPGALTVIDVS